MTDDDDDDDDKMANQSNSTNFIDVYMQSVSKYLD